MAQSNILGGDVVPPTPPGHGTADLGPSDTSDSGSDIAGAPGTANDARLGAASGTTSDLDRAAGAGPDLGDIEPDRITDDPGGMTRGDDPEGTGVSDDSSKP